MARVVIGYGLVFRKGSVLLGKLRTDVETAVRSPNGEDVLYVFHARAEGRVAGDCPRLEEGLHLPDVGFRVEIGQEARRRRHELAGQRRAGDRADRQGTHDAFAEGAGSQAQP